VLLLGTNDHLEDLDREYSIGEGVSVTAIAPMTRPGANTQSTPNDRHPEVYVVLDAQRLARVDGFGLAPVVALDGRRAQSAAGTPAARVVLVGLEGGHLAVVDPASNDVEAVTAFDDVPGRDDWENPAGPFPDLRSIAVTSTGTWLVNVHVGGVWRSTDRGASWANVVPPEDDVHEVVAGEAGRVVAAAAVGFGWSLDDGVSWEWTTDGLHASYCRAVAVDGDIAFVTASTGPSTADGRLYRGPLGSGFAQCREGLPESFPFNLDTGCLSAGAVGVAFGTRDGRVWRSYDTGQRFEAVPERVGRVQVLRFA